MLPPVARISNGTSSPSILSSKLDSNLFVIAAAIQTGTPNEYLQN
jgi:hypothetical protein